MMMNVKEIIEYLYLLVMLKDKPWLPKSLQFILKGPLLSIINYAAIHQIVVKKCY